MACSAAVCDRPLAPLPHAAGEHAFASSSRVINRIISANLRRVAGGPAYGACLERTVERSRDALGLLPLLTCQAASGESGQAIPVVAAWRLLRLSAKLLDDAADGDSSWTSSEAIRLATGLLFVAPLVLEELGRYGVSPAKTQQLTTALQGAALRASAGQYRERTQPSPLDPDGWLGVARLKSGEPCAWASWAGALVSGTDKCTLRVFREYGLRLGLLLQVADDFCEVWQATDTNDLQSGQLNFACCYARYVASAEQHAILEGLLQRTAQGDAVAETQVRDLLTSIGSQAYLLVVANEQRRKAKAALRKVGIADGPLVALLDQIWPALSVPHDGGRPSLEE